MSERSVERRLVDGVWRTVIRSGDELPLRVANLTLTDEQIKALPASPFDEDYVVVPAPGPDKVLLYISGYVICDTTSGLYEYGPTQNNKEAFVGVQHIHASPLGRTQASARLTESSNVLGLLFQSEDVAGVSLPPNAQVREGGATNLLHLQAPDGQELALVKDAALSFTGTNGDPDVAAPYTGGHPDNYLTVYVVYAELDLAA